MSYIIRFTDSKGAMFYWPAGFGFSAHAFTAALADAERFDKEDTAIKRLTDFLRPSAFWESERRHAAAMIGKMRGWKSEVVQHRSVYTLGPGRTIERDGKPVAYIARVGNDAAGYALAPYEADELAREIVAGLRGEPCATS